MPRIVNLIGHYSGEKLILQGNLTSELPHLPSLLWSISTGARTKSSPVISNETIYFGNEKGSLIAVGTDGKIKWSYEAGSLLSMLHL